MPLGWHDYDAFDWENAQQQPMSAAERRALTELAADLLDLAPADRDAVWGAASPPGRFAATVVHVSPNVSHRYLQQAASAGIGEIGLKLFKTNSDAQREGQKVIPFHQCDLARLPGLPNSHVQRSLAAGVHGAASTGRAFIVQQWVCGDSLEDLVRRRWPTQPISADLARLLVGQLLGQIVIPLWSVGTLWWDVRDANYCFDGTANHLSLIDVDSLGAYADEILRSPHDWTRRDKGRGTALSRLRQMTLRLLLARGLSNKRKVEASITQAWNDALLPALQALGKSIDRSAAEAALAAFIARLAEQSIL